MDCGSREPDRYAGPEALGSIFPMQPVNEDIFQMDLGRDRSCVRLRTGADTNRVEAVSADRSFRQVLLFVQENSRSFERKIRKRHGRLVREPGFVRVPAETPYNWIVERFASNRRRAPQARSYSIQERKGS